MYITLINYNIIKSILISSHELTLNIFQLLSNQKDQLLSKNLCEDMPLNVPKCSHFFKSLMISNNDN